MFDEVNHYIYILMIGIIHDNQVVMSFETSLRKPSHMKQRRRAV